MNQQQIESRVLKAAKALEDVLNKNSSREYKARWALAWTAALVPDRAAMIKRLEGEYSENGNVPISEVGKKVVSAFRNDITVTKAMAAGYGGELPPEDVRRYVEQWAPKTWQQLTAKVITPIAEAGDLANVDPGELRKQLTDAKARPAKTRPRKLKDLDKREAYTVGEVVSIIVDFAESTDDPQLAMQNMFTGAINEFAAREAAKTKTRK